MTPWKRRVRQIAQDVLAPVVSRLGLELSRRGAAWELIEPEQLRRFLARFDVDCVFDVGANAGQYGSRLREVGFSGRIISFEPNPEVVTKLRSVAQHDELWVVKEIALDSVSRPVTFNLMKEDQFSSLHSPEHSATSAFVAKNAVERKISLTTQTLDELYPSLKREFGFQRPFLKMDTQGHDVEVVKGGLSCIGGFIGLQSELAITRLYEGAPDLHSALEYYRSLGFKLSGFIPNNAGHFPDLNEVDCIMYNSLFQPS